MKRLFAIALEVVEVDEDGAEHTEFPVFWPLTGKRAWKLDESLLDDIKDEVRKRK